MTIKQLTNADEQLSLTQCILDDKVSTRLPNSQGIATSQPSLSDKSLLESHEVQGKD